MTTITILPEEKVYRAVGKNKESVGRTAGEALDALTAQFGGDEETPTVVIIQTGRSDRFFNSLQQARLTELMDRRKNQILTGAEEVELEDLIEAELNGARERAEELIHELKP